MPDRLRDRPLSVWAPSARAVSADLRVGDEPAQTVELESYPGGWWAPTAVAAGRYLASERPVDYMFRVDDADPVPDPRSAWQPEGVHGRSRLVDLAAFDWHDAIWAGPQQGEGALGGVFYEMHVGTFTPEGTFDAALSRLDHLVWLGVDVVQVLPVAAFPGEWGWGYDGVALYAVHDRYGGPRAFQRFVDACHQRGLGVALDVVYNHLGPSGNYLSAYGPYFTESHQTPWGAAVNLDAEGSAEVRAFIIEGALRWLREFHLDALRLDAVHEFRDDSERPFLAELSDAVADLGAELGRPLALVAESDLNDPVMVTPTDEGGLGMSAQWDDDVHHALHVALTGETQGYYADFGGLSAIGKVLTDAFYVDGVWSQFRGRAWGARVDREQTSGHRFMAYLQTHDQVGNRALGDRIGATLSPGQQAVGAALVMTSAFTPMVFMGEEWMASTPFLYFSDHGEPELAAAVSNGRRREFADHGWEGEEIPDPQDHGSRDASVLRWQERRSGSHQRVLDWYHDLIDLRRQTPELRDSRLDAIEVRVHDDLGWMVVERGTIRVLANFAEHDQHVPTDLPVREVLLAWETPTPAPQPDGLWVGGQSVAIVRVEPAGH